MSARKATKGIPGIEKAPIFEEEKKEEVLEKERPKPEYKPPFTEEELGRELKTVEEEKKFLEELKRKYGEKVQKAAEEALARIRAEKEEYKAYASQVAKGPTLDIDISKGGTITGEIAKKVEELTGKKLTSQQISELFYEVILPDNSNLKPPHEDKKEALEAIHKKATWEPKTAWDLVYPGDKLSFGLGEKTQSWLREHGLSSVLDQLKPPAPLPPPEEKPLAKEGKAYPEEKYGEPPKIIEEPLPKPEAKHPSQAEHQKKTEEGDRIMEEKEREAVKRREKDEAEKREAAEREEERAKERKRTERKKEEAPPEEKESAKPEGLSQRKAEAERDRAIEEKEKEAAKRRVEAEGEILKPAPGEPPPETFPRQPYVSPDTSPAYPEPHVSPTEEKVYIPLLTKEGPSEKVYIPLLTKEGPAVPPEVPPPEKEKHYLDEGERHPPVTYKEEPTFTYSSDEIASHVGEIAGKIEPELGVVVQGRESVARSLSDSSGRGIKGYEIIFNDPYFKAAPEEVKRTIIEATTLAVYGKDLKTSEGVSNLKLAETEATYALMLHDYLKKGGAVPQDGKELQGLLNNFKKNGDFLLTSHEVAESYLDYSETDFKNLLGRDALEQIPDIDDPGRTFEFLVEKGFFTKEDIESFKGKSLEELKDMGHRGKVAHTIIYGGSRERRGLVNASDHVDHYFATYIMREGGPGRLTSVAIHAGWNEAMGTLKATNWNEVDKIADLSNLSPQEVIDKFGQNLGYNETTRYLIDKGYISKDEILTDSFIDRYHEGDTKNALKFRLAQAKTPEDYQTLVKILEKKGDALFDQFSHTHTRRAPWRLVTDLFVGGIQEAVEYPYKGSLFRAGIDILTLPIPAKVGEALKPAAKVVGKELAEGVGEKIAKEVAEEAGEKVVREVVEETGEKVVKEVIEEGGERAGRELTEEVVEEAAEKGTKEIAEEAAEAGAGQAGKVAGQVFKKFEASLSDDATKVVIKMPPFGKSFEMPLSLLEATPEAQRAFGDFYDDMTRAILRERVAPRGINVDGLASDQLAELLSLEWRNLPNEVRKGLYQLHYLKAIGREGVDGVFAKGGVVKDFSKAAGKALEAREKAAEAAARQAQRAAQEVAPPAGKAGTKVTKMFETAHSETLSVVQHHGQDFGVRVFNPKTGEPVAVLALDGVSAQAMDPAMTRFIPELVDQSFRDYQAWGNHFKKTMEGLLSQGLSVEESFNRALNETYQLAGQSRFTATVTGVAVDGDRLLIASGGDGTLGILRGGKYYPLSIDSLSNVVDPTNLWGGQSGGVLTRKPYSLLPGDIVIAASDGPRKNLFQIGYPSMEQFFSQTLKGKKLTAQQVEELVVKYARPSSAMPRADDIVIGAIQKIR